MQLNIINVFVKIKIKTIAAVLCKNLHIEATIKHFLRQIYCTSKFAMEQSHFDDLCGLQNFFVCALQFFLQ